MRAQALAIALVLAAATSTFVLSTGVHGSLTQTRDAYYARNAFADVFCDMTRAPRSVIGRVAAISGIAQVDGRLQQYASLSMAHKAVAMRALINSVGEKDAQGLNRITLRKGHFPRRTSPNDVIVDEAFAEENGLTPGDKVNAIIYGRLQPLTIIGIGLAPDFIYALAPGDLVPDSSRFGIFWMGKEALEAATNNKQAINVLSARLQPNTSEPDVIRKMDAVLRPYGATGCYGRKDHLSHAFVANELAQLDAMTKIIPPVFLLVAIFLVYIVLGRMIQTERGQIGLLKAFGYSNAAVAIHYLKFALAIALVATLVGTFAGVWMGRAMAELYLKFFRFPFLEYHLSPQVFLGAAGLAFGAAGLGALAGIYSVVKLAPAVAMMPPPPPVYRTGALDSLGQAAGFSATGHMILRHIARWPWRSTLTVFGVALSLALLFSTLQFLDSSKTMIESYFFRSQRQDMTILFTEPRNQDAVNALRSMPGILRVEPVRAVPVKLSFEHRSERAVLESSDDKSRLSARIDSDGREIDLPANGLMLSQQLASKLGVTAGAHIHAQLLGGRRTETDLPVVRIVEEFVGERAYASPSLINRVTRDSSPAGAALVRVDPARTPQILTQLNAMPRVLGIAEKQAAIKKFEEMINDNIFTMLFFYISFASAIAVGVVYNCGRILFSERAHELATLRVLGYFRSEVAFILLGEVGLLILAAIPVGCVAGYWLAQFMVAMFSSDLFRLPFTPARMTFGYASLIILAAASLTALLVARRVSKLDMIKVLKAHD